MKKLTVILSLYIFALTIIPCTDDLTHQDDENVATTEMAIESTHFEICSPFCSDHDCNTPVTVSFISNTFMQTQFCELEIVEKPIAIPTPYFAIWQPPKIG